MKLNYAQLEAFYTVAQTLNFTKAADMLNVTQSALSQRIAKLEEELESTLFTRNRVSVRLTESGYQVLRFCELNEMAEADLLQKLKGSKDGFGGTLRIGGYSSVNKHLVIPAFKQLMLRNPSLSIQLVTKEIRDLEDMLRRSEADYIITNKEGASSEIESLFLGFEENIMVRSKKHPELEIYLDHDEYDNTTKRYFSLNKLNFSPKNMRYLDDVHSIIEGVKCGYGKAVLSKHLIANEKDIEIVNIGKVLKTDVYLQFYRQPYYRQTHAQILKDLKIFFSSNLSQKS